MQETGEIIGYDVDQDGSRIQIAFPGRNLMDLIAGKHARSCTVWIPDGRGITPEQRKKAYATIADIADYTGELPEVAKEWLKYLHIARTGSRYFSLSDCTRDEAREFISTLMDLALEWGIPLGAPGIDRADDIERYLWSCLKKRRCAVCGRPGEIHHVDAIGMGRDRKRVDDRRMRKICLCREHHTEAHKIGQPEFMRKYHVHGIYYEERREQDAVI